MSSGEAVQTRHLEEQHRRQSSVWDGLTTCRCGGRGIDQTSFMILSKHQFIPIHIIWRTEELRKNKGEMVSSYAFILPLFNL